MIKGKFRIASDGMLLFWCPGCKEYHGIYIDKGKPTHWNFNNDYNNPTFSPSILVKGVLNITDEEADRILKGEKIEPVKFVCHSFIRDGKIQFLNDCTHKLAGQTVDLPNIPEDD